MNWAKDTLCWLYETYFVLASREKQASSYLNFSCQNMKDILGNTQDDPIKEFIQHLKDEDSMEINSEATFF